MDQQETHLHRGALRIIHNDKPLHKQDVTTASSVSIQSLPNREAERADQSEPRTYKMRLMEAVSEPRPRSRRRFSSDYEPSRLFDEERRDDLPEAFALRQGLRHRKTPLIMETREELAPEAAPGRRVGSHGRSPRPRSRWLLPAEHPLKTIWDIVTVFLSIVNAYATHVSIRDRKYDSSLFMLFCDVWFFVDILLNFVTERKTAEGEILRDYRSICARYLTSWFAVDALSLFPWETLYVKPIIDLQNRQGFFKRSFFRSKAAVRVTRHLRGKHVRWFGKVARHSKQHGVGIHRLIRLIIKYVPKYVLFVRNMKGVVAVRVLRQFHWLRRFYKNMFAEEKCDGMTGSITRDDFDDDLSSNGSFGDSPNNVQVVYEDWEVMDDGVPL